MQKLQNKKVVSAFTLAEMLVTVLIISSLTIMSVPMLKKSKFMRAPADKNWWYCTLDKNNAYTGGSTVSGTFAKTSSNCRFIPPPGVTRYNVTVVGGGGSGAAGEAGVGTARVYFSDTVDKTFVPVKTKSYQVIAIGGGGGGGGGGYLGGRGRGGGSGAVIMENVTMTKSETYNIVVGQGGIAGKGDNLLNPFEFLQAVGGGLTGWVAGVGDAYGWVYGLPYAIIPKDKWEGGGKAGASGVVGGNTTIYADGGRGGSFRHLGWCKIGKWFPVKYPCKKWSGGSSHETAAGYSGGNGANGRLNNGSDGGVVCSSGNSACLMNNLAQNLEGEISELGKGGRGGSNDSGYTGNAGYVQIKDTPVYGGGGGQSGVVSFFSYDHTPLTSGQSYVEVFVGKGGNVTTALSEPGQKGEPSRFGNRVVADGGIGGIPRVTDADENLRALGEDGGITSISSALLSPLSYFNSAYEVAEGGKNNIDGQGFYTPNMLKPGTGGGGGGALGTKTFVASDVKYGTGGAGAPGVVIVTW